MEKHWMRYSLQWTKPLVKKHKWELTFLFILMLFSVGLSLIKVNFIQQSIDAVLMQDVHTLIAVFLTFTAIAVLRLLYEYFYGNQYRKVFLYMEKDLKNAFVHKILKSKMKEIENKNSGDLNTKCSSDIPNAVEFVRQFFSNYLLNPIMTVAGFIYILQYSWKLSIFVFLPIPILAVLLNIMSDRVSAIYGKTQSLNGDYSEQLYDMVHGMDVVKSYNMQPVQLQKMKKTLRYMLKETKKYDMNIAITLALILAVTYVPMITAFIYGAYLVSINEINVSLLFGYSQLIEPISTPVINLFSSTIAMKNACQSMKRLDTVMEMEEEREGGCHLKTGCGVAIRFDKVSFQYSAEIRTIESMDFSVKKGQCIGITGSSGSGKSTVAKLICGLYEPNAGKIELFGYDSCDLNLRSLREQIAYVSQYTYIMPGTIAENIRFGNSSATDGEIWNTLEKVGLKEYTDSLPEGINTQLYEDGDNLSGGQRQRISLARAFLQNASIYIFDEPTSSLDPENEKQIIDYIKRIAEQRNVTSFIISHNPDDIYDCDEVWHVKNGKVERGSV